MQHKTYAYVPPVVLVLWSPGKLEALNCGKVSSCYRPLSEISEADDYDSRKATIAL